MTLRDEYLKGEALKHSDRVRAERTSKVHFATGSITWVLGRVDDAARIGLRSNTGPASL